MCYKVYIYIWLGLVLYIYLYIPYYMVSVRVIIYLYVYISFYIYISISIDIYIWSPRFPYNHDNHHAFIMKLNSGIQCVRRVSAERRVGTSLLRVPRPLCGTHQGPLTPGRPLGWEAHCNITEESKGKAPLRVCPSACLSLRLLVSLPVDCMSVHTSMCLSAGQKPRPHKSTD